jgi:hypothetical protein
MLRCAGPDEEVAETLGPAGGAETLGPEATGGGGGGVAVVVGAFAAGVVVVVGAVAVLAGTAVAGAERAAADAPSESG